jgi:hypothetical protein
MIDAMKKMIQMMTIPQLTQMTLMTQMTQKCKNYGTCRRCSSPPPAPFFLGGSSFNLHPSSFPPALIPRHQRLGHASPETAGHLKMIELPEPDRRGT